LLRGFQAVGLLWSRGIRVDKLKQAVANAALEALFYKTLAEKQALLAS
jgi:hypothetical protein